MCSINLVYWLQFIDALSLWILLDLKIWRKVEVQALCVELFPHRILLWRLTEFESLLKLPKSATVDDISNWVMIDNRLKIIFRYKISRNSQIKYNFMKLIFEKSYYKPVFCLGYPIRGLVSHIGFEIRYNKRQFGLINRRLIHIKVEL